ncbi:uncharacterized protein EV154DRAFT_568237 [Mucor mucedo]|uniref:uncharacterized protein n=1 Tax=Mucor mucedo TaxID=29922 RepID=UPI00222064C2|nr:uncharacterized protein EV154DRAFT_568237 [Mucor mucedo]KAI7881715.1 hypothetical protein EV154DRAFT_568237 [Mucor mucedo]
MSFILRPFGKNLLSCSSQVLKRHAHKKANIQVKLNQFVEGVGLEKQLAHLQLEEALPSSPATPTTTTDFNINSQNNINSIKPKTIMFTKPPKYSKDQDLEVFFSIFETAAELNEWSSDKQKLQQIHQCFKGRLLNWVVSRKFDDWLVFKQELREKLDIPTRDDIYYLNEMMAIKRKNFASVSKFITKFDDTMTDREASFRQQGSTNQDSETRNNETSSTHDTKFYIQLFIRNSSPADMRRFLNSKKAESIKQIYKSAKEYEDDDSSDNSSSDDSDSDTDASDSDEDKPTKKAKRKSKSSKVTSSTLPDFQSALLCVLEQNNKLLLLQQNAMNKPTSPRVTGACYNCNVIGHLDRDCPSPCKHCNSTEHKRYFCPVKPARTNYGRPTPDDARAITNGGPAALLMGITDDLCEGIVGEVLMVKRTSDDAEISRNNIIKKKLRSQVAKEVGEPPLLMETKQKDTENTSCNVTEATTSTTEEKEDESNSCIKEVRLDLDDFHCDPTLGTRTTEDEETIGNEADHDCADSRVEIFNSNDDASPPKTKTPTASLVKQLRQNKVFQLSFDDIVNLSSKAHTEFRRPIENTKAQEKVAITDILYQKLELDTIVTQGNHAPRIKGKIGNKCTKIALFNI